MKTSHAGGRKTQNDAARPALGNALEQHVETVLAAMAKGIDKAFTPFPGRDSLESHCRQIDTAARLGSATAAVVSAAARLNGRFHHDIRVQHVHYFDGLPDDAYDPDDDEEEVDQEAPVFTDEELKTFTPDDLMREIPIRQAQVKARETAERLAAGKAHDEADKVAPTTSRAKAPLEAEGAAAVNEADLQEESETPIARLMNDIEAKIAAAEEDGQAFAEDGEKAD